MPGMTVSLRVPEDFLEDIQRKADQMQVTVSELLRQRMTTSEDEAAAAARLSGRLDRLEQQLSVITAEIEKAAAALESLTPLIDVTNSSNEGLTRLVGILDEEKKFPFGMNRNFVQVATMASFTLAKGTFSNAPDAWEPYKKEARRRAFQEEGVEQ